MQDLRIRNGKGTSTHDLHTEVDTAHRPAARPPTCHFNSRPPHGGRLIANLMEKHFEYFNSRPPHGGRLARNAREKIDIITSTHDLHTEVDVCIPYVVDVHPLTSTHDLHTEVDALIDYLVARYRSLQLTTSTRRSTTLETEFSTLETLQLTTSTRRSTLPGNVRSEC